MSYQHILANRLEEISYPSTGILRNALELWDKASKLPLAETPTNYEELRQEFSKAATDNDLYRKVKLFGCLLAYHAPAGYGKEPLGHTIKDARVLAAQKWLWLEALGIVDKGQAEDIRIRQAGAAENQAWAAIDQAEGAVRYHAWAAKYQAGAARYQTEAAVDRAEAARDQVWAATYQAEYARFQVWVDEYYTWGDGYQARDAEGKAEAARNNVWKYARSLWNLVKHFNAQKSL